MTTGQTTDQPRTDAGRGAEPPMIVARGLRKRYGDIEAVAGIDMHVERGEFFGMLGPNGAGKTSTIGMISCVLPISDGTLHVAGLDVRRHDRDIKSLLGVVPQNNNLDPDLSVLGNLLSYARFFDIPRREARAPRRRAPGARPTGRPRHGPHRRAVRRHDAPPRPRPRPDQRPPRAHPR